ncbi:PREDICTED: LOW QUALITY PROTEIN: adenylate cyclase type 10 [Calidris pugnax]|uniref:LOW QUALITY PROTEIN: adenylate cyclase type 10 n=1 Tax=Calidris pugnax TaxID=198806 RepID=UPI00071E497F|nr:PREDICTED: LOW QUALITY PROTEIN: adenylate cyclase type 10 [Calidris pugnax]
MSLWAQLSSPEVPRVHRVLTMASAWEKNYHHSDLEKAAAFLPSLLTGSSFRSTDHDQTVHGVLLFADVSGFTTLTEKFIQKRGKDRGTDELAQTLNEYLCDILGEFLVFGGDILKFAGDAVLVLWRTTPRELARTISLVLHCSLQIQKKYRRRETDVGQEVQLKIGVSAGTMSLSIFGDRRRQHLCLFGQGVGEVNEAEELAGAGDIVLSATAWEVCEQHRLRTKHLAGQRAVKGQPLLCNSSSSHASSDHPPFLSSAAMRPALLLSSDPSAEKAYRKYIPAAALGKLDERVPLQLFSELRPVTIIFIQLVMLEILSPHKGKINKVLLCDKGCTFLCVLGLTGNKLPSESIRALQCALQIYNACSTMLGEREAVSVAVTSGTTFCGVIGHPLRHEYTVIGQKVNLAARMMGHYPGLVSCDAVTYAASRLPPYYFRELPEREMKGISQPGPVYQYMGITEEGIFGLGLPKKRSEYVPLLGRKQETDLFVGCLTAYRDFGQGNILAFEGTTGSGKSHLLAELASLGQGAGHRVVSMELLEIHVRQSFSALRTLMARTLGLQDCGSCIKRQRLLKRRLQGTIDESSYCLLNDIFLVEFPLSDKVRKMRETERKMELHSTWRKVLEKMLGGEFGIFVIDNAHFIDPASWSIMSAVLQNVSLFMVMSLAPGYARTESFHKAAADSTTSQKITYIHLDKLNTSAVVQKVCKDLGGFSISKDLERVVSMELLEIHVRQSFSALRTLMARTLGLQDCGSCIKRQRLLKRRLQGTIDESSYCLLNDIFLVEFPLSDKVRKMRETERKMELHSTWRKVLEKMLGGEFGIFVIDNAHFIDPASWSIMSAVLQNVSLFMVMSLAPGYARTESFHKAAADSTTSQKITYIHLDKLNTSAVVQKVCKDLGGFSISKDLESRVSPDFLFALLLCRFLMQRSSGIPYYCEELLRCLHSNNMLLFCPQRAGKAEEDWEGLITSAAEASSLAETGSSNMKSDGRVCTIRPGVNLENTVLPVPLKEIALTQLDQMKPLKQMILKFAAVIGPVFTTQLLSHILPTGARQQMNPLLDMLVSEKILRWLKTQEAPEDVRHPPERPATSWHAESGVQTTEQPSGALAFCVPLLQEAAYELWPRRQRVALHRKCAAFLQQHAHRCGSCGQGEFVACHRFAVTSSQEGGSCRDPADQGNLRSWEALVLTGEQLRRERIHAAGGTLMAERNQRTDLPSETNGKPNGDCSCQAIVESVLVPLARHCLAAGDAGRAFYYLLESAAGYLHVSNSHMALMKLNEAEVLRKTKEIVTARFEEAIFFSLKGEVCCHMNRLKLAKKMIRKALSLLKRHFPRSSLGAFIKSQVEKLPCAAFVRRAASLPQEIRRKRLASLLRQSCCLSLLEQVFRLEGTSRGRRFSDLAARMKANTDREADSYQAADSGHP